MEEGRGIGIHVAVRSGWKEVSVGENAHGDEARKPCRVGVEVDDSVVPRVGDWNQPKIHARRSGISDG